MKINIMLIVNSQLKANGANGIRPLINYMPNEGPMGEGSGLNW